MSGILQLLATASSNGVVAVDDHIISDTNPGSAVAFFTMNSDGTHSENTVVGGLQSYGDWVSPPGFAALYEVRVDPTGDALHGSSSATGSWLAMSSNRTWGLSATSGGLTTSLAVQVRPASGSVVDTATISLSVDAT